MDQTFQRHEPDGGNPGYIRNVRFELSYSIFHVPYSLTRSVLGSTSIRGKNALESKGRRRCLERLDRRERQHQK